MKKPEEMKSTVQKLDNDVLSEVNGGAYELISYFRWPWPIGIPPYYAVFDPRENLVNPAIDSAITLKTYF